MRIVWRYFYSIAKGAKARKLDTPGFKSWLGLLIIYDFEHVT